jgi:peptidoglycan hydrolase-like protein with peptidoglycan-binding domain
MPLVSMFKGDPNLGAVNQYVMLLQRFLVMNGVLTRNAAGADPVNGKFDDATELAVKTFQGKRSVPVSGIVKGRTWAAIAGVSDDLAFVDPTNPTDPSTKDFPLLRLDDQDSVVTVLQRLLFEYSGSQPGQEFIPAGSITKEDVDGLFGNQTKQAVEAFQSNRAIQIDGEVGPETWEKLLFPKGRH